MTRNCAQQVYVHTHTHHTHNMNTVSGLLDYYKQIIYSTSIGMILSQDFFIHISG